MRLDIENIGKIKKCSIEFNGITILAGENSTGKSTISKVLYCAFDSLYNSKKKINNFIRNAIFNELSNSLLFATNVFFNYIDRFLELKPNNLSIENINNVIKSILRDNNYAINDEELLLDISKRIYNILMKNDVEYINTIINRTFNYEFNHQINSLFNDEIGHIHLLLKKDDLVFEFLNDILFNTSFNTIIENDILYFDNPLVITVTDVLDNSNTKNQKIRKYIFNDEQKKGVVEDTILSDRLKCIEHLITDFEFHKMIKNNGDGYAIKNNKYKRPLNINNLSMGSKSLFVLLQIFNSSFMKDRNLIILDEPEINLHPEWQLKLAEMIVALQKEFSFTFLISSHSPYFINAIETFSNKYKIDDRCKYYFATNDTENKYSNFSDCSDDTEAIYSSLANAFDTLMKERGNL